MSSVPSAGPPATAEPRPPRLRPANYVRNVYHVANALFILVVAEALDTREQRIAITVVGLVVAWGIEAARVVWPWARSWWVHAFGTIAHPHEERTINSGTWYVTALVILSSLFPIDLAVAALMVLGVGDPAAAIIGRRFGRIRTVGGRTLEGSLAFVVAGFLAAWATLAVWHPDAGALPALALAAAVGGAVGELLSRGHLDDNLVIPLVAAGAAVAARWVGA